MTPLRSRMIEDMKLAGLAAKTQEVYLQAVSTFAKHYKKSPELLTEEEVRRYLLDVRAERPGQLQDLPLRHSVLLPQHAGQGLGAV